jgi:site-specific DNA-methyltransferase (adenine-specific)
MNVENRTIFEGDNLHILRGLDSETIDLIYLDPPFNSNRTYEAPIGSEAAGAAFKDAWTLSDLDNAWHGELAEYEPGLYSAISASEFSHGKSMKAYLIMMGIRMLEMRRVLKPTGSIYLHCDPTASHYLKTMMDSVFGQQNFRNEIIWQRIQGAGKAAQHKAISYGTVTDQILFYAYGESKFDINSDLVPFSTEYLKKFKYKDSKGLYARRNPFRPPGLGARPNLCYEYKGFYPPHPSGWTVKLSTLQKMDQEGDLEFVNDKVYRKHRLKEGMPANNLWLDIPPALGNERTGYPTQKPLALLERIIKAGSDQGDIVLDPFCGCATTCIAAEKWQRNWIGIDLSPKAVELVKMRLERDLDLTEHEGLLGDKVIHRTDIPTRLVPDEPRQIHAETLFSLPSPAEQALSQVELRQYRSYKHTLFGIQEGKCNGCQEFFRFRNLTIDHIHPRSRGGTDDPDNLQLLCGACNSTKGDRTQEELIQSLREQGVLRE